MIEILPNGHPIMTHFTIGLLLTSSTLFLIGSLFHKKEAWSKNILIVAHVNLWIGALFTLGTVATGIYAYYTVAHDAPSHLAMKDHRNWALASSSLFIILAICAARKYKQSYKVSKLFLAIIMVASIGLATTGYKGGELVYRHGLGVLPLQKGNDGKPTDNKESGHHHNHGSHSH